MSFASFHTASSSPSKFFHEAPRAGRGPWQYPCIPAPKIEEKTLTTAKFPLEKTSAAPRSSRCPAAARPFLSNSVPRVACRALQPRPTDKPLPPRRHTFAPRRAHLHHHGSTPVPAAGRRSATEGAQVRLRTGAGVLPQAWPATSAAKAVAWLHGDGMKTAWPSVGRLGLKKRKGRLSMN